MAVDGDRLVSGANWATIGGVTGVGAAYIWDRVGTVWGNETKLVASDGTVAESFGFAVDLRGNTIVVGVPWEDLDDDTLSVGAVYTYRKVGTSWVES